MDYLKESFQINKIDNIQQAIKVAGEKIGWNSVSVLNNEIEFKFTKHMTRFVTKIQWTDDGIINLSSNYVKPPLMDMGSYRSSNNEKIKLSILREVESKKISVEKTEKSTENKTETQNTEVDSISNNEVEDKKEKEKTNNESSQTSKVDEYTKQIEKKDEDQKKKLVIAVIIGLVISGLYWFYTEQVLCGCSEDDISGIQKLMLYTRSEAIDYCCKLKDSIK